MGGAGGVGISAYNYYCMFISGGLLRRLRYNFPTLHPHAVSKRLILADTILEKNFFPAHGHFLGRHVFLHMCSQSWSTERRVNEQKRQA